MIALDWNRDWINQEPFGDEPCEECGAQAIVVLVDFHKLAPVRGDNGQYFERNKPVEHHAFCAAHCRPPRAFDIRGKLITREV